MAKRKGAKYIKLTAAQKDEIRRLTQLANRRIKAAERAYRKAGKDIVPLEIVGKPDLQTKEGWHTASTPLSRSVKFTSEREYKEQLRFLRSFDPKATRYHRPGIKEYTQIQREKVGYAIKTSLGDDVSFQLIEEKLSKLSAPEIADFWNTFSEKAARAGLQYSSEAVMAETFVELFPEDLYSTIA